MKGVGGIICEIVQNYIHGRALVMFFGLASYVQKGVKIIFEGGKNVYTGKGLSKFLIPIFLWSHITRFLRIILFCGT